jgi:hypothetical protein
MANANWSNPQLTSTYTNFVSEVKNRDEDLALQFDGTTSTNIPTGTIRWDSSANRWKKWSGSAWGELTSTYALTAITSTSTVTGTALIPSGSTAPTNGVYLPAANTVGIATASTGRLFVDASGNVAIGVASGSNSGGYSTLTLNGSTGGQIAFWSAGVAKQYIYNTSTDLTVYNGNGSTIFINGGSEKARIDSSGRVGIGSATSLGYKLNVYESGTGMINALHLGSGGGTAGNGASISFGLGNGYDPTVNILAKIGGIYTGGGYDGALTFSTCSNTSQGANPPERMRIDSSGKVGIGTTSPQEALDLNTGNLRTSGYYIARTNGRMRLYNNGNSNYADIYCPNTDANAGIAFNSGAGEAVRIDSAGLVGIGTASPSYQLDVAGYIRSSAASQPQLILNSTASGSWKSNIRFQNSGSAKYEIGVDTASAGANNFYFYDAVAAVNRAAITSTGVFQFDSGYGSSAAAYGCRAWVNFNGTGTVAIRASGNVSSITDNGVGDYTVNFTTAMPDANYSVVACSSSNVSSNTSCKIGLKDEVTAPTTSAVRIVYVGSAYVDPPYACISIFR